MAFYLLFLFPKNLEADATTMPLAHHTTPVLPIGGTFGAYTQPSFPDQNTTQHSSQPSPQTLFLKPPLPSQWTTIPFSPLFFPDNLSFGGKFSLTLLRIHPLSLGCSPFWDIGDLLYYMLSNIYLIQILLQCVIFLSF